jgi:hypothetical protein
MPFCPKCATTGDSNATFCTVCGASLPSSSEILPNGPRDAKLSTARKLIAIIFGLFSIWLGVLLFHLSRGLILLFGLSLAFWLYTAKGKASLFFAYAFCAVLVVLAFVFFAVLGAALSSR